MKNIYFLILALVTFSCSMKTQPYYFSYYQNPVDKTVTAHQVAGEMPGVVPTEGEVVEKPEFSASIEARPATPQKTLSGTTVRAEVKKPATTNVGYTRGARETQKKFSRKEFKAAVKDSVNKKQDSKDGFAIAGFVCSIVGLFVLWPLCVLGIVFSALGLKSGKRGLAIAGLVIGIIGVVLVIAAGSALVAA